MAQYETLTKAVMILPKGESIFCDRATTVELEDEAAGLFVRVVQYPDEGKQAIAFDAEEWPMLRAEIDNMVQVCLERNTKA